ncbi:MAG TPA: hypothetical protein VMV76_03130 [Dehalococcoidia bacterium]|nr:hypothetical protein [Dehalococcoidia bacterium]
MAVFVTLRPDLSGLALQTLPSVTSFIRKTFADTPGQAVFDLSGITSYHISMNTKTVPKLTLFPLTAEVNKQGHLVIGGCDVVDLAEEFGTPLYLFDESTLRHRCREFKDEFCKYYPDTLVIYASKAFLNRTLALIFKKEGLGLDVVSGKELSIAHSVDFPLGKVYFHGNNKTLQELNLALDLI